MHTFTIAALATLALGVTACGSHSEAKVDSAPAQSAVSSHAVTFKAQPAIAEGVAALPRLVGDSLAIETINADLERRDAAARAGGCDSPQVGGNERGILQPMTGPGYVSFWIAEGFYCDGAAHPGFDQTAITYDLTTGQPVDWVAEVPGLHLTRGDTADLPATYVPGVSSAALSAWYSAKMLASTDAEWLGNCRDVFSAESMDGQNFKIRLDAENGGVTVNPDFARVIMACGESATLTPAEMRGFGVSQTMIDAVTAAHAAGNWAPRDDSEADSPVA